MAATPNVASLLECSVCLDRYNNPKQLDCDHHFCKQCLDSILKFDSSGSASIVCPNKCPLNTTIGVNQTTNDLRVSYDFKKILEAYNLETDIPTTTCQYTNAENIYLPTHLNSCKKEVAVYCCGMVMCTSCNKDHERHQHYHQGKASVYFDKKDKEMRVLCEQHSARCTHICTDEEFLCTYCINREHEDHTKYTIESKGSSIRQVIVNDSGKVDNITESLTLTESRMQEDEKKFDRALIERKTACLLSYLHYLNKEEKVTKKKFKDVYMEHTKEYPSPNPPEYYVYNLLKTDTQLVVEEDAIIRSLGKSNITNSQLRHVTIVLNEEFDFCGVHPLGDLRVEHGEHIVTFSDTPATTFNTHISEINDYPNTLAKLKEQLNELLQVSNRSMVERSVSCPTSRKYFADETKINESASAALNEDLETSVECEDKPDSKPDVLKSEGHTEDVSDITNLNKEQEAITAKQKEMTSECVTKLDERGITYVEELVRNKENEKLRLLVGERPDVIKLKGIYERTPFHLAALYNNADTLQLLVQHGAAAEVRDRDGWTALHYAAYNNNVECVEWLLQCYKQLIDTKATLGNTPLHYAASNGHLSSLKLLLTYGADTKLVNGNNRTALQCAQEQYGNDCVKELQNVSRSRSCATQ